jgi:hypothetical protein
VFWIGLFLAGALLSGMDAAPLAMAVFPVPVAVLWARGRPGAAVAAVLCGAFSVLAGQMALAMAASDPGANVMLGVGAFILAAAALAVAGLGAPLGEMIRRGRSFGQCVSLLTLALFGLVVLETVLFWDATRKAWTVMINQRIAQLEQGAGDTAPYTDLMRWFDVQLPNLVFGVLFTGVFVVATLQVGAMFRWLRNGAEAADSPPPVGKFKMMRPPDALVWLAIAAALLGLADYQWPNDVLRFVSWNTGVALAAVYWMNGVGIALCAMEAFGLRAVSAWGLLGLMMLLGLHNGLAVIGLFDTWFDQRAGALRLAAAWRDRNREGPQDPEA